jgi:hypothetical protein
MSEQYHIQIHFRVRLIDDAWIASCELFEVSEEGRTRREAFEKAARKVGARMEKMRSIPVTSKQLENDWLRHSKRPQLRRTPAQAVADFLAPRRSP